MLNVIIYPYFHSEKCNLAENENQWLLINMTDVMDVNIAIIVIRGLTLCYMFMLQYVYGVFLIFKSCFSIMYHWFPVTG